MVDLSYRSAALIAVILLALLFVPQSGYSQDVTAPKAEGCVLTPLPVPPTPKKLPGYTEKDVSTGLHVTGTMQQIDVSTYRLRVTGKVVHPLSLTYDDLRCMSRVTVRPRLVCPGFFVDIATWSGVPVKAVLERAGLTADAKEIRLTGADNYSVSMAVDVAGEDKNFLAYEWEGKALPRLHGFPLRAIFPDREGNQWVKWLVAIEVH